MGKQVLDTQKVAEIKWLLAYTPYSSLREIAEKYGCHPSMVGKIRDNQFWEIVAPIKPFGYKEDDIGSLKKKGLTGRDVAEIKWILEYTKYDSYNAIGRKYSVSGEVIRDIRDEKIWKRIRGIKPYRYKENE